jgi:hypothetical protein
MQVRSGDLGRKRIELRAGWARWNFACAAVVLVATACAGEDPGPAASATRPGSDQVPSSGTTSRAAAAPTTPPNGPRPVAAAFLPGSVEEVAIVDRSPALGRAPGTASPLRPEPAATKARSPETPIERANHAIAQALVRYREVNDYTCTFYKRERIAGRLTPQHIMMMKVRCRPQSIYFKFQQPARGREAIYVAGRNNGKVQAHDVGLNRLLAGTLELLPTSARAMEDCRHPITEAGIGPLLETLKRRWAAELDPAESVVRLRDDMTIGAIRCTMIESTHPERRPGFLFYRVRVFIDQEIGLPVRFEAYDWPKAPTAQAELAEEYSYMNLKLNVGLTELDFDVSNRAYSFGRF